MYVCIKQFTNLLQGRWGGVIIEYDGDGCNTGSILRTMIITVYGSIISLFILHFKSGKPMILEAIPRRWPSRICCKAILVSPPNECRTGRAAEASPPGRREKKKNKKTPYSHQKGYIECILFTVYIMDTSSS